MKNQKRNYHETAEHGFPVQALKKRRQTVIFNHRAHLGLQAPKPFINSSTWEKQTKISLVPENVAKLQQNKELHNIQFECKNSHDRDVSLKKRVRFSEAEIPVQQNKNLQKLDSSTKNCSTALEQVKGGRILSFKVMRKVVLQIVTISLGRDYYFKV
ncbi:uncharacterized protein Pyn_03638 [Prunus yedoensis var. nudiflora]|uniref:Uncharacterized protein n=1 Tax=Prunus yedoensis var. nudiflora TaxID=2094558 RepID=A0A314XSV9_PRUYE|nr:uncharacterized protein Pyn_03638 [Prunus yedoensis var. nudiflora]